jgi:hypothetical protein
MTDQKTPGTAGRGMRRVAIWIIAFVIAFAVYYVVNKYVINLS